VGKAVRKPSSVIPAEAGIRASFGLTLDSRLRGNDENVAPRFHEGLTFKK
jgi:hypothetical protein